MGDNALLWITAVIVAIILMVVFPLMTTSDRNDELIQLAVQTEITEFGEDVCTTGVLTYSKLEKVKESLDSKGYKFDIEMQIMMVDENPSKKVVQASATKYGENENISEFTTQIEEKLNVEGEIILKEGWRFIARAKNSSSGLLDNLFSSSKDIVGEFSGVVVVNGY